MKVGSIFGFLVLLADIFAIVKLWRSGASDGSKIVWTAVIFFLPLLGLVAWFLAGPGDKTLKI